MACRPAAADYACGPALRTGAAVSLLWVCDEFDDVLFDRRDTDSTGCRVRRTAYSACGGGGEGDGTVWRADDVHCGTAASRFQAVRSEHAANRDHGGRAMSD